jgi:hypothetical protein
VFVIPHRTLRTLHSVSELLELCKLRRTRQGIDAPKLTIRRRYGDVHRMNGKTCLSVPVMAWYPTNTMLGMISRNSYYDLPFLTVDPKMPSHSKTEDIARGCVVRATTVALR